MVEPGTVQRLGSYRMARKEQILGFNSKSNTGNCHWPSPSPSLSVRKKNDVMSRPEVCSGERTFLGWIPPPILRL